MLNLSSRAAFLLVASVFSCGGVYAQPLPPSDGPAARPANPYLEQLTSQELKERLAAGTATVIVPIGGTEQNGPHMVLGKHNRRVSVLAGMVAQRLGNAVVAPVVSYVPEGAIKPPSGHMRFAGTISLPEPLFEGLLQAAGHSLKQHGFKNIVFIGDHGGYQKSIEKAAAKLNKEWANEPGFKAVAVSDYYRVTQTGYVQDLRQRGFPDTEIGTHAGLADTSLSLAIDPSLVRSNLLLKSATVGEREGVSGDPHRASAELGELAVQRIVAVTVAAIRVATNAP